jgi:hypothetical protein
MPIRLTDLIEKLKEEIRESINDDPMFVVESASITTKVSIQESATANGGLEILIVKTGLEAQSSTEDAHEITINLRPKYDLPLGSEISVG